MKTPMWIALGLALAACGKSDKKADDKGGGDKPKVENKLAGGCDRREKEGLCGEYHGAAKADWVKKQCDAMKVPFVDACPKDNAVGRCVGEPGTAMEVHTLYYGPKMTKDTVTAMCKSPMQVRDP